MRITFELDHGEIVVESSGLGRERVYVAGRLVSEGRAIAKHEHVFEEDLGDGAAEYRLLSDVKGTKARATLFRDGERLAGAEITAPEIFGSMVGASQAMRVDARQRAISGDDYVPREGPFALNHRVGRTTWLWTIAAVVGFGGGTAALPLAVEHTQAVLRDTEIWRDGVSAGAPTKLDVDAEMGRAFIVTYDLSVRFEGPNAKAHTFDTDFVRIGMVPDEEEMEVRHREGQPDVATTSWNVEARMHRWAFAGFAYLMGVASLVGLFVAPIQLHLEQRRLRRLAASGRVFAAFITGRRSERKSEGTVVTLKFRNPNGGVEEHAYLDGARAPRFIGPNHVLVVASRDGGEVRALRSDGYPLVLEDERISARC